MVTSCGMRLNCTRDVSGCRKPQPSLIIDLSVLRLLLGNGSYSKGFDSSWVFPSRTGDLAFRNALAVTCHLSCNLPPSFLDSEDLVNELFSQAWQLKSLLTQPCEAWSKVSALIWPCCPFSAKNLCEFNAHMKAIWENSFRIMVTSYWTTKTFL